MTIELINTGSELMLGRIVNSHQQWLCRELADRGYVVARQVAVADTAADITAAVREALTRADLIITTGGLGPTSDDITRDEIARLLDRKLTEHAPSLANIERFFTARKRVMPASTRVQALVPEGALVLTNGHGTAPGLAIEVNPNPIRTGRKPSWLVMLPGPPRELRPMFSDQVVPLLREKFPLTEPYASVTLRTLGLGESYLEERIAPPLQPLLKAGVEIGYCARTGDVDVRLSARGADAARLVADAERLVRELISQHIYGTGDDSPESILVQTLTERKQTLALAESCTGGHIANRITNVPGASAVLLAGFVTYSNAAKQSALGVRAETLAAHGAVSEPVAREMAEGARARTGADFALGVTGIAGPTGGSEAKPVGTVFIAL
ncbi:MAG: competence/damage-inducible protein A, partial [Verrucomicrobia bacterium]|nr:competence/damage-inducible protein A [Verrucomicrobiota bacterium]